MDLIAKMKGLGNALVNAKELGTELAVKKASGTKLSKSGTGVHSPGSFGVSAETGAPPTTARMAGGIGLEKLAATLIHTGVNEYLMPHVERSLNNVAEDIRGGLKKGVTKKIKAGY
tara:strand:- start:48 stop:395 length:348 start_codon:yes stop_codon:yes gene_type:complete